MDLADYIKKQNENLDSAVKVIEQYKTLQNNVNRAIEYINENINVEPKELYGLVDGDEILKILKGTKK